MKIKVGDKVIFTRKIEDCGALVKLSSVGIVTAREQGRELCVKVNFDFELSDGSYYEWFMEDELEVIND